MNAPQFAQASTTAHALVLFGVALAFSAFGAYATAVLGMNAFRTADRSLRLRWMLLAILACTSAIWADALMVILAMSSSQVKDVASTPMALAYVATFVLVGIAAQVTIAGPAIATTAFGGAVLGLAIPAALFIGIGGPNTANRIEWDVSMSAAAVGFPIGFTALTTVLWVRSRSHSPLLPIALLTLTIFADHVIGMHAITVVAGTSGAALQSTPPQSTLAVAHVFVIVGLIAVVLAALTIVAQSTNRKDRLRSEADRLQLQQLVEVAVEGLAICEGGRIVWINRSLEAMLAGSRAAYIGAPIDSLLVRPPLADVPHDREIDARLRMPAGAPEPLVPVRIIKRSIAMGGRPHIVLAVRDQRDRLLAEAEMHRLASRDPLTGLANRAQFNGWLSDILPPQVGARPRFALLALDLDRFKSVNDTYGHAAGDAVLREVGERLAALIRGEDRLARIGGDEFSILAIVRSDVAAIGALADRAIAELSRPFDIEGRVHQIGVSVGIAIMHAHGDDPEALARSADLALYRAKSEGGGTYRFFEEKMRVQMEERHDLEQALRLAVVRGEFCLYYQPQVSTRTLRFNGAEALIRWNHPQRGLVGPADFIGIAEETNLIATMGQWVLRTACMEAVSWPDDMRVAVNLSPAQFRDPALAATVEAALTWSGLPGRRLELEITESVLIADVEHVKFVLDGLKRLGIQLSLDDFGTGYSSLGHLHRFPFDKIKIDRSFIGRLPDDKGSAAIVRAVVALGAGLGMQTTAEGVEYEAQLRFVSEVGCDQIQGYLFSRPVPASALPVAFRVPGVADVAASPVLSRAVADPIAT